MTLVTTSTHTTITKYPTKTQIALLCSWGQLGPAALDPVGQPPSKPATTRNLIQVKGLISRLGMPAPYEGLRRAALGDVHGIDGRLWDALYTRCRLAGRVLSAATAPVPLTGLQLHVLRLTADGMTTVRISLETGLRQGTIREVLYRARESYGCASTTQLASTAYREGWFPGVGEARSLMSLKAELDKGLGA